MRIQTSLKAVVVLLVAVLLLAGCGGGGGSAVEPAPQPTPEPSPQPQPVPGPPAEKVDKALNTWHWRKPLPQGNNLNSISFAPGIFGKGQFVAVGDGGTVLTSPDGVTWAIETSGTTNDLLSITYGGNLFVAVGRAGTIITSPDGVTWTARASGTTSDLASILFGTRTFVAVGYDGTILSSLDGINWTTRRNSPPGDVVIYGAACGNGTFAATAAVKDVSSNGYQWGVFMSSDGITWSTMLLQDHVEGITYGKGMYVAGGTSIYTLPDGKSNWTKQPGTVFPPLDYMVLSYANGLFIGTLRGFSHPGGSYDGGTAVSSDGLNWGTNSELKAMSNSLKAIAYGNGTFIGVGNDGLIAASPDGQRWTERSALTTMTFDHRADVLRGVSYGNGAYVAAGWRFVDITTTPGILLASSDGTAWVDRSADIKDTQLSSVVFLNGSFLAVGNTGSASSTPNQGVILASSDGHAWRRVYSGGYADSMGVPKGALRELAYGNGKFVAVGDDVLISPDGVNWAITVWLCNASGIAYGNGVFVVVGPSTIAPLIPGAIATSADGTTWTTSVNDGSFNSIVFMNGLFVAAGNNGTIVTSSDGKTWTPSVSGTTENLTRVTSGKGAFVALSDKGSILTSFDGMKWTKRKSGTTLPFFGVAAGANSFVVVGGNGFILESDPIE